MGTFGLFLGDQRSSVKLELDQSVVQTSGTTLHPLLKTTKSRAVELADAAFTPPSLPPCAGLVGYQCPYTTSYQKASLSRISCQLLGSAVITATTLSAATVAYAEPGSPPPVAMEGTDTTANMFTTEQSSSTAEIALGVLGGLAALDLVATGIRYHDEIAATGQYSIAATYNELRRQPGFHAERADDREPAGVLVLHQQHPAPG